MTLAALLAGLLIGFLCGLAVFPAWLLLYPIVKARLS